MTARAALFLANYHPFAVAPVLFCVHLYCARRGRIKAERAGVRAAGSGALLRAFMLF